MATGITTHPNRLDDKWEGYDIIAACHEVSTSVEAFEEEAIRSNRPKRKYTGGKWPSYQRCVGRAAGTSREIEAGWQARRRRMVDASSRQEESERMADNNIAEPSASVGVNQANEDNASAKGYHVPKAVVAPTMVVQSYRFCDSSWVKPLGLLRLCPERFPFSQITAPIETRTSRPTSTANPWDEALTSTKTIYPTVTATVEKPITFTETISPTITATIEKLVTENVMSIDYEYATSVVKETGLTQTIYNPVASTTTIALFETVTTTSTLTEIELVTETLTSTAQVTEIGSQTDMVGKHDAYITNLWSANAGGHDNTLPEPLRYESDLNGRIWLSVLFLVIGGFLSFCCMKCCLDYWAAAKTPSNSRCPTPGAPVHQTEKAQMGMGRVNRVVVRSNGVGDISRKKDAEKHEEVCSDVTQSDLYDNIGVRSSEDLLGGNISDKREHADVSEQHSLGQRAQAEFRKKAESKRRNGASSTSKQRRLDASHEKYGFKGEIFDEPNEASSISGRSADTNADILPLLNHIHGCWLLLHLDASPQNTADLEMLLNEMKRRSDEIPEESRTAVRHRMETMVPGDLREYRWVVGDFDGDANGQALAFGSSVSGSSTVRPLTIQGPGRNSGDDEQEIGAGQMAEVRKDDNQSNGVQATRADELMVNGANLANNTQDPAMQMGKTEATVDGRGKVAEVENDENQLTVTQTSKADNQYPAASQNIHKDPKAEVNGEGMPVFSAEGLEHVGSTGR